MKVGLVFSAGTRPQLGMPLSSASSLRRADSRVWQRQVSASRRQTRQQVLSAHLAGRTAPRKTVPALDGTSVAHLYSTSISSSVSMCSDTKLTGTASRLRTPCAPSSLHSYSKRRCAAVNKAIAFFTSESPNTTRPSLDFPCSSPLNRPIVCDKPPKQTQAPHTATPTHPASPRPYLMVSSV